MDKDFSQGTEDAPGLFDHLPVVPSAATARPGTVELGAFSISLNVADLDASREFYEKLGFVATGGEADQGWLILMNGESVLGLFHGMFDRNILTFNPGLTNRMERLASFTDVRDIQAQLEAAGLALETRVEPDSTRTATRCSSTSSSDRPTPYRGMPGEPTTDVALRPVWRFWRWPTG